MNIIAISQCLPTSNHKKIGQDLNSPIYRGRISCRLILLRTPPRYALRAFVKPQVGLTYKAAPKIYIRYRITR